MDTGIGGVRSFQVDPLKCIQIWWSTVRPDTVCSGRWKNSPGHRASRCFHHDQVPSRCSPDSMRAMQPAVDIEEGVEADGAGEAPPEPCLE